MEYTKTDEIRFWSKVDVRRSLNHCWEWRENTSHAFGYGSFRINKKTYSSHRLSLIFFEDGNERKDKKVLHSCDNPACCNPHHLRWGSQKENVHDSIKRGRHKNPPRNNKPPIRIGENNNKAKLTKKKVVDIIKRFNKNKPVEETCSLFDISKSTYYQVVNRKTWRHVNVRKEAS